MDVSSYSTLLPAGAEPPKWVQLLPAGVFSGVDGRGPWCVRNAQAVIDASMAGGKLPIDENHSTDLAVASGAPAPARGWIIAMQARADGIWGEVEWTNTGNAIMTDKQYKGISPVFNYDKKDGAVLNIMRAALTNNPNLTQLASLNAANKEGQMDKKLVCTALGIAETVDDAAVLTALNNAVANATALNAAQAEVTSLKAKLTALETTSVPAAKVVELETALNTMKADMAHEKAVAFVDGAIKAGKPINASRDVYISMHVENPAQTEKLVNKLPSINAAKAAGKIVTAMNDPQDGDMSAEDMAICAKMNVDPTKLRDYRKQNAAKGSAA
jgi:phage I-like protein